LAYVICRKLLERRCGTNEWYKRNRPTLWDIKGKALGVPIYELLGGAVRQKIRCYTHVIGEGLEELASDAKELVKKGWNALKFLTVGSFKNGAVFKREDVKKAKDGIS
jgi:L-alanine-DL-glutamate epimerase-like enolase superfamily enzyme